MATFHMVQKSKFEEVFFKTNHNRYLLAYRHADTGNWVLAFSDSQLNHWIMEAQRGGARQFRSLDTLHKYVADSLGGMTFQVRDYLPSDMAAVMRGAVK